MNRGAATGRHGGARAERRVAGAVRTGAGSSRRTIRRRRRGAGLLKTLCSVVLCALALGLGATVFPTQAGAPPNLPSTTSGEGRAPIYDKPATILDVIFGDASTDDATTASAPVDGEADPEAAATEEVHAAPAEAHDVSTWALGVDVASEEGAVIDYSNRTNGYVMVRFDKDTGERLKAVVEGPTTSYQYDVHPSTWMALPLSDGQGGYTVTLYDNVGGTSYTPVVEAGFDSSGGNPLAPFLHSNAYVDIEHAPASIAKASELCGGAGSSAEKVSRIYDWVVRNVTYDGDKAQTVQSGYMSVLDDTLGSGTGICLDYVALVAGMLRSQGVASRVVVGDAGSIYHAWLEVYDADTDSWRRMDPTFDADSGSDADVLGYIGDDGNYSARYYY